MEAIAKEESRLRVPPRLHLCAKVGMKEAMIGLYEMPGYLPCNILGNVVDGAK